MKILQLTDLHFGSYPFETPDLRTVDNVTQQVSKTSPDLIVVSGDLVNSEVENSWEIFEAVVAFLDSFEIPVAITYGNHDSEGPWLRGRIESDVEKYGGFDQAAKHFEVDDPGWAAMIRRYNTLPNYSRKDLNAYIDEHMENHVIKKGLEIVDEREMYYVDLTEEVRVMVVDGGDYDEYIGFYASLLEEQIPWIVENAKDESRVTHLFLHIPLPEHDVAKHLGLATGHQDEGVCSPEYNIGAFAQFVLKTNIVAVYVGHDHENDFVAPYQGINLTYGRVGGYHTYGDMVRGARVIEIDGTDFRTYIVEHEE